MNQINQQQVPLVAIIRGVTPDKCIEVANALVMQGFSKVEVPLNSPDALTSIKMLVEHFSTKELKIGAGTVTNYRLAEQVISTGANLLVTPNCNESVIKLGLEAGCEVYPGVISPTEAFKAVEAGATKLKLFPISMVGIEGMKAMLSVLPKEIELFPVGGINPTIDSMQPYINSGATGFGLGSSLYKPEMALSKISENAERFIKCYQAITA